MEKCTRTPEMTHTQPRWRNEGLFCNKMSSHVHLLSKSWSIVVLISVLSNKGSGAGSAYKEVKWLSERREGSSNLTLQQEV